ncbi:ATP-binding protein [Thermococcus sp. 21S7]|uniref:ATP-binding protein n=1 Tax=Thermococcus sp. 21S7 TaxID=1638221 RepID=UPI001439A7FE|nr:ATP-binding protein [Thermococcus sp. 21S7]NJE61623.1 ATP-binding protein [Thermococcus sp. 21S7]
MKIRKFVDRGGELKTLEMLYRQDGFTLVLVTGRRRIGKSRLVREFLRDKEAIAVQFEKRVWEYNLAKFNRAIGEHFGIPTPNFSTFTDAFRFIASQAKGRLVVFLDEFSYLLRYSEVEAEFQSIVDEVLSESSVMLVLSASSVGLLKRSFFDYSSPLYGRSDATLNLQPLRFRHLFEWFSGLTPEDSVKLYAVTSGVPRYLELFNGKDVEREIIQNFFDPNAFLFREAKELLEEEFREPETYYTILEALARGKTRVNEIAQYSFIEPKNTARYLRILEDLGILRRELPVGRRAKRGVYRFKDLYFAFWFRFIAPYFEEIESGFSDGALEDFGRDFNHYLGFAFEDVARQILIGLNRAGKLPFRFTKIGRWWRKGEEIDLVALNEWERKALLVEVKWKDLGQREARGILKDLERKAELVGLDGWEKSYGLVAKSIEGKEKLEDEGWLVWDLEDFNDIFPL